MLYIYMLNISFLFKLDVCDVKKGVRKNMSIFRKKYNLKASRIHCQLIIKENQSFIFTNITCASDVMVEGK